MMGSCSHFRCTPRFKKKVKQPFEKEMIVPKEYLHLFWISPFACLRFCPTLVQIFCTPLCSPEYCLPQLKKTSPTKTEVNNFLKSLKTLLSFWPETLQILGSDWHFLLFAWSDSASTYKQRKDPTPSPQETFPKNICFQMNGGRKEGKLK